MDEMTAKLNEIDRVGCNFGKLTEQKIINLHECTKEVKEAVQQISNRMMIGIVLVIILAFFAGMNTWQEFVKIAIAR